MKNIIQNQSKQPQSWHNCNKYRKHETYLEAQDH